MTYKVFHRTWWQVDEKSNQLEPGAGRRHKIGEVETMQEARKMCFEYNSTHSPGRLGDRAEFEEVTDDTK
jgi:hypothetical protein